MCISSVQQIPFDKRTNMPFLVFNANKLKIVEFTQESVFMRRKPYTVRYKTNLMFDFAKCIFYLFHLTDEPLTI